MNPGVIGRSAESGLSRKPSAAKAWLKAIELTSRIEAEPHRLFADDKPLLFLVAPALHVHPATDTLLHYISPEIDWALLGVDERWRDGVRVLFRKRPARHPLLTQAS